ncbi:uncharacterized protein ACRADG_011735 isoform 1-T5 [Cochliomyia hominivorax]
MVSLYIFITSTRHIVIMYLLLLYAFQRLEATSISLIPLKARNVYQVLRKSNNMDAIPEGRVVTQGIAAVTGFTLGLKKAIGATLVYDIITANITEDASNPTVTTPMYTTQEICFSSRGARSLYEAEAVAEAFSRLELKENINQVPILRSQKKRVLKPKRDRKKNFSNKSPKRIRVIKTKSSSDMSSETSEGSATLVISNNKIQTSQPTGALDRTNLNSQFDTDTTSTTTSTDNDQTITCIVIQTPKT